MPEALVIYVPSVKGVTEEALLLLAANHDADDEAHTHSENVLFEAVVHEVRSALGCEAPDYSLGFELEPISALGRDTDTAHRLILAFYMDV